MAFTIILNPAWAAENGIRETNYTWHIQSSKPEIIPRLNRSYQYAVIDHHLRIGVMVDMLQAEGDELALINMKFENLPTANMGTVTWRGDMASFIFNNL